MNMCMLMRHWGSTPKGSNVIGSTHPVARHGSHVIDQVPLHTHRLLVVLRVPHGHALLRLPALFLHLLPYFLIVLPLHPAGTACPLQQHDPQTATALVRLHVVMQHAVCHKG